MDGKNQIVKDYYYILGVPPEATREEIEESYRELYDKYGPHVTIKQEDPEAHVKAYKDICEAWEVLSNPARRREYDRVNLPLLQKSHLRSLWGKFTGAAPAEQQTKPREAQATEVRIPVEISLYEAMKGTHRQVRVEHSQQCQMCVGKKPVDRLKCPMCTGAGVVRTDRPEDITIPPGTPDKSQMRLPGRGKLDPRSGRNADVILEIQIQPNSFFTVIGNDVACTVPVTIYEAILGGEIDIPTPTGKVVMKIQPLTQRGRVYRLKGLGLGGGDLLATIEVNVPTQLNTDEVLLFRKLKDVSGQPNPRAEIHAKLKASRPAPSAPPQ